METLCCVCKEAVSQSEGKQLGERFFCARHHESALRALRPSWGRSGLVEAGLIALFVAGSMFFGGEGKPLHVVAATILALIPSTIWLWYVYRRDALEPEPWGLVIGVVFLGALFGQAVAKPMIESLFSVDTWRYLSPTASWISALLVATVQQFCVYIVVRYTVYLTDEFDEPMDGVVYACAAGLGLATAVNIDFVIRSGAILPLAGAVGLATTSLLHVAAGAVLGHGLGESRCGPKKGASLRLLVAFVSSILTNAAMTQLVAFAGIRGGMFDPWRSLTASLVVAAIVLFVMDVLTYRLTLEAVHDPNATAARP